MKGESGLWAHRPELSGKELEESLALLAESQKFLRMILLGLAVQYRSLDLERLQLLCPGQEPEPKPLTMQTAAGLINTAALAGFLRQAESLAHQSEGCPPDLTDVTLGAVSLFISILRLLRLQSSSRQQPQGEVLEALEEEPEL